MKKSDFFHFVGSDKLKLFTNVKSTYNQNSWHFDDAINHLISSLKDTFKAEVQFRKLKPNYELIIDVYHPLDQAFIPCLIEEIKMAAYPLTSYAECISIEFHDTHIFLDYPYLDQEAFEEEQILPELEFMGHANQFEKIFFDDSEEYFFEDDDIYQNAA
ncbi:MAG: hypothetical protein SFY32_06935 [Bacteroidota bacterium]|nr:hypothetical protein [Bacteroidota bacterium]